LMGDPDQLPPVDTGSLFGEMASSFGIFLEKSLRTEEAHLQDLASLIRRGDHQELLRIVTSDHPSFVHLPWKFDSDLSQKLYREIDPILSFEKPDPQKAIEKYQRCRILNALRQGPFGVDHLNNQIFHLLEQRKQKGQWWAIPILITVNDSRSQLYNGTSGVLIGQNLKDAVAYFPDDAGTGVRALSPPAYEMAFCLSIHKSQGSEFEEVLSLFPEGSENFGREALYTAATRSKKRLKIAGHLEVLQKMLSQHSRKRSGFSERIVCPPID
jgi:exodeoxyribonuclease V alpha subunit